LKSEDNQNTLRQTKNHLLKVQKTQLIKEEITTKITIIAVQLKQPQAVVL
jgi:hypothetical protein